MQGGGNSSYTCCEHCCIVCRAKVLLPVVVSLQATEEGKGCILPQDFPYPWLPWKIQVVGWIY
eukprot:scaffold62266_cov21-Tisochrysis_lutea.AAC.1